MELTPGHVRLPSALDVSSVAHLSGALEAAFTSSAPVVTLVGADADIFCLGLAIGSSAEGAQATHAFADLLARLHQAPKPLLAVVDGRAIGGGMGLACACDWLVASERATFGLPELLWGLIPAVIWPVIAGRMPAHVARQWTISAHTRAAAEGVACGLVDELVPADRLARAAERSVHRLSRLDPVALGRFREWARTSQRLGLPEALHAGADITAEMVTDPSVRARWQAFELGETPWSA